MDVKGTIIIIITRAELTALNLSYNGKLSIKNCVICGIFLPHENNNEITISVYTIILLFPSIDIKPNNEKNNTTIPKYTGAATIG